MVGGGSFNAAPLLEPGVTYRDTLLLGEYNYYAFPVGPGQRLHVDVRVPDVELATWERGQDAFAVNLHTPQREQVSTPVDEDIAGNGNSNQAGVTAANIDEQLHWEFYGPRTEPFLDAAEDLTAYQGPGIWYVSLHSVRANDRTTVAELPVEVTLDVEGETVREEPDPTPTPSATPAADGDARRRRRRRRRRRSEPARRARARRARAGRRPCRRPGAGPALSRSLGPSRGAS